MDYATNDKRAAKAAQKQRAKTPAQKRRGIPFGSQPKKGCSRGAAGHSLFGTASDAAYGFLRCRFLPHFAGGSIKGDPREQSDFYRCFGLLCTHYRITPIQTRSLGYPYSRAVALWDAKRLLLDRRESITIECVYDTSGRLCLEATETYHTGSTLYYIPIVPLYGLLQSQGTKKGAQLLLFACAYLYKVAGIPYYRETGSYLYWQYGMIREWVEDDPDGWEDENYTANLSQLDTAEHIGNKVLRRLKKPFFLQSFAQAVEGFIPLGSFGCDCLAIAKKALGLWRDYPHGQLLCHADTGMLPDYDSEDYDGETCIAMDKYIGFCADTTGWLYQTLAECVNNEFAECAELQQPVLQRVFDGRVQDTDSLDFDCRLFSLMDELCIVLNSNDYENT
jgi:hypothetical protein